MNTAYLILGGNKGNRSENLKNALETLGKRAGEVLKKSEVYSTKAWGNTKQPDFLNQVICLRTFLTARELLNMALAIEESLGRVRTEQKWTERTMDIDILYYNDEIINTADLKIPHPYIKDRKFVLIPLAEIAKEFIHPVTGNSTEKMLKECNDNLEVWLYNP